MKKTLLKDALGWGFLLWLIGYALGFVFFALVPPAMIGWVIMPIGVALTLWVLFKKVNGETLSYYLWVALSWTVIAVVLDYFLLFKILTPTDGYYKLDVYLYYVLLLVLPLIVGWYKLAKK